ncbi:MAG: hypothetical protein ABIK79_09725 [Chloroflexota bacterium]|nr:hypothetical protein [Anaerolineae bacterium]
MRDIQMDRIRDAEPIAETTRRSHSVTMAGLLLLTQALGLLAYGPILTTLFGQSEASAPAFELLSVGRSFSLSHGVGTSILFMPLSLPALLAGIGLLRLRPSAWTLAMLTQGLSLTMALVIYSRDKPIYIYPLMIYSIVAVLYLNYNDVQVAFRPKPRSHSRRDARRGGAR